MESKYGRVTAELGDIPADEPVVLFRGKDVVLPDLLAVYWDLCREAGSPPQFLAGVQQLQERVALWQKTHQERVHTPD